MVPAASCGTGASIQNPLGKTVTHVLSLLTMNVRFPVLLLESPTLRVQRPCSLFFMFFLHITTTRLVCLLFRGGSIAMSVTGNILSCKVDTLRIQDRNRRGVFAYFFTRKKKVGPGAGTAQRKKSMKKGLAGKK